MRFRNLKLRLRVANITIAADEGSIAPLAILGVLVSLVLALVVLSADQLFQQQRNLNSVSDALALDLADLKLQPKTKIEWSVADQELGGLSSELGGSAPRLRELVLTDENRVSVSICQHNRLLDSPITGFISGQTLSEVCVTSVAENR